MDYSENNNEFEEINSNYMFMEADLKNFPNNEENNIYLQYNDENNNNSFFNEPQYVYPKNDINIHSQNKIGNDDFDYFDNNEFDKNINSEFNYPNDEQLGIEEEENLNQLKPASLTEPKSNINIKSTKSSTTKFSKIGSIFEITKNSKIKVGRKRKNSVPGNHNKYSPDNLIRKMKSKLFSALLFIINSSQKGKSTLFKLKQEIIKDTGILNNRSLLKSKLKYVFANEISSKYINYGLDHNKKIIEKIYKEKKDLKTISILERTFLDGLEHFRGSKYFNEFKGLEAEYSKIIQEFKDKNESEEYINSFKEIVNNFEQSYQTKNPRVRNKNN